MDLINFKLFVELIVEDNRESVLRATLARADDGIRLYKNMYIDTKYVIKGLCATVRLNELV